MDDSLPSNTPLTAAQQMWPFTVTHFVLIALFAALAVYIIWRGRRLKRRRREAEAELLESGHGFRAQSDELEAVDPAEALPKEISSVTSPTPAIAEPSDLTILKGVGPRVAARLAEQGVGSLSILAGLTAERAAAVDAQLGSFAGRMARDKWVEQARLIVSGNLPEYERQFGKLDQGAATTAPPPADA